MADSAFHLTQCYSSDHRGLDDVFERATDFYKELIQWSPSVHQGQSDVSGANKVGEGMQ